MADPTDLRPFVGTGEPSVNQCSSAAPTAE